MIRLISTFKRIVPNNGFNRKNVLSKNMPNLLIKSAAIQQKMDLFLELYRTNYVNLSVDFAKQF